MGYCRGCGHRGDGGGSGDGSGGCGDGGGSDSGRVCCCCCCDMSGLGIIDGMRMTRYRMTTSSGTATVGISRRVPSSPSPGTSNGCKPHTTSHYRNCLFCLMRISCHIFRQIWHGYVNRAVKRMNLLCFTRWHILLCPFRYAIRFNTLNWNNKTSKKW